MIASTMRTLLAAATLSAVVAGSSSAQTIHNTGQGAQGTTDPFWSLVGGSATIISDANLPGSAWVSSSTSRWISIQDSPYQPTGVFTYFTTFDLTGFDPLSAMLSGRWTADDDATLFLNGNSLGSLAGTWGYFTSFAVNGGSGYFLPGVNTLSVAQHNSDGFYDAFNVDQLSVQANAVTATPEPASLALMATGLLGMAGVIRRRRAV